MEQRKMKDKMDTAMLALVMSALLIAVSGCAEKTMTEFTDQPSERPDYLPEAMFKNLPEMPADFYHVRQMVRTGEIKDLNTVWPQYYLQPEWFPGFEDIGIPLLQSPPENRWGAFGLGSYPSDTVIGLVKGDTLTLTFYMRSSYLVETYQGIGLVAAFPESTALEEGYTLPDGTTEVKQDASAKDYFDVEITPEVFVLEPNFPIYAEEGTEKIDVKITAKESAPSGKYVVAVDVGGVSPEQEERWIKEYGSMYAVGGMTKLGRPYFRAFITVGEANKTEQEG